MYRSYGKLTSLTTCILSALLLVFIFPLWGKSYLAWFAFIPLLWFLRTKKDGTCFFCGFLTGVLFFYGLLYWLSGTMVRFGGLPVIFSYLFLFLLCIYLGLYVGVFSVLVRYFTQKLCVPFCIIVPIVWTTLEFIRSRFLTGFPWGIIGYSQAKISLIIQIADLTGVYGISFLILFVNAALTDIIILYTGSRLERKRIIAIAKEGLAIALVLGLIVLYGYIRLNSLQQFMLHQEDVLKISILQGNIPQDIKRDITKNYEVLEIYGIMSSQTSKEANQLIIWPETACTEPVSLNRGHIFHLLSELAKRINSHLLLGCPRYNIEGMGIFNSAFLFSPTGNLKGFYDKIHLVPFGEYFPINWVGERLVNLDSYSSGSDFAIFEVNKVPFSVIICFEAIFPHLCRSFIKKGSRFLINLTNDAWFGKTAAPYQHFDMACLRAVENRVWFARVANSGVSAIVNPLGRIVKKGGIFERLILEGEINAIRIRSIYVTLGDLFANACVFISLLWCFLIIKTVLKGESRNV